MDQFYKPLTKKQLKALIGGDGEADSSASSESSSDAGGPGTGCPPACGGGF